MDALKCHGGDHSKQANLNLSSYCSSVFLPLKLFSLSVFLSFYLSAFFDFLSSMSIHKSRSFPSLKHCQKKLGQSWTKYYALVCYFRVFLES